MLARMPMFRHRYGVYLPGSARASTPVIRSFVRGMYGTLFEFHMNCGVGVAWR
jgi:hypothetical protein